MHRLLLCLWFGFLAWPAASQELLQPADLESLEAVAAADARLAQAIAAAEGEQDRLAREIPTLEASIDPLLPQLETARQAWQRVYEFNAPDLRNLRKERLPQDIRRMEDEIARAKAPFDALLAQIVAIHEAIEAARAAIAMQEDVALANEEARLQLRAEADRRFVPAALIGLEIAWGDAGADQDPLYRAVWEWGGEDPTQGRYIDWLFAALTQGEEVLAEAERNAAEAERRFVLVSDYWQRLNRSYVDQTTYLYFMDSVLAFAGVGIAIAGNLETWPAALLWEAADALREYKPWRLLGGVPERRYDVPQLSDEVIRLRQQLAEGSLTPGSLDELGSSSALVDPTTTAAFRDAQSAKLADEMTWEGIKSGLEVVYGVMAESLARKTVELSQTGQHWAIGRVMPALLTGELRSAEDYHRLYRKLGGDSFETGAALLRGIGTGGTSVSDAALDRIGDARQWKDWAKGAAIGAGFEVLKQIWLLKIDEERVQIYHQMAATEIRWFLLRNDYVAKMQLKRTWTMVRRSLLQELGRALNERAEQCCERSLIVALGKDLALPVAEVERRGLRFALTFDRPVTAAWLQVSVPEVGSWPVLYSQAPEGASEHAMTLQLSGLGSDDGTLPGALDAMIEVWTAADGDRQDGNPATVAHLDLALALQNAEQGRDGSHRLRLVAPVLRILSPPQLPPLNVPFATPCEAMSVEFDAGQPLPATAALAVVPIAPAGERRSVLALGGQQKGTVAVTAPAEEGQYLLALTVDPARPEALLSRPFFVDRLSGEPAPEGGCLQRLDGLWDAVYTGATGQPAGQLRMQSIDSGRQGEDAVLFHTAGKTLETAPSIIRCARQSNALTCRSEILVGDCPVRIVGVHLIELQVSADGALIEGAVKFMKSVGSGTCAVSDLEPGFIKDFRLTLRRVAD